MSGNGNEEMLNMTRLNVDQAKQHVQECRAREKLARENLTKVMVLKKKRQKGGSAAATSLAESELEKTIEAKSNAEKTLKTLEQKVWDLEQQTTAGEKAHHRDDEAANGPDGVDNALVGKEVCKEAGGPANKSDEVNLPEELARDESVAPGQENDSDSVNLPDKANLPEELATDESVAPGQENNATENVENKRKSDSDRGESDKRKRGKLDEADKRIKAVYMAASKEEKKSMRREALKQMRKFMKDPEEDRIQCKFRKLIREVQEFCPEAATTTRGLALHCLETNRKNMICPYHADKDKGGSINDQNLTDHSPYAVTGTPYARAVKGPGGPDVPRRRGHLHCGCPEEVVLLDFYFWKMGKIGSTTNGEEEGWKDQRLDPRARMLVANEWEFMTGLTVDDIYSQGKDDSEALIIRLTKQINNLQEKLADATAGDM